jgi:hypothetical protein
LYDKKNNYKILGTVPMNHWNFDYSYTGKDAELIFAFIPRNAKWGEYRFPVDFALWSWNTTCVNEKVSITEEVIAAETKLWKDASVLWILIPSLRKKDDKVIKNLKNLMLSYKESEDEYTKNIWIYLGYLLANL